MFTNRHCWTIYWRLLAFIYPIFSLSSILPSLPVYGATCCTTAKTTHILAKFKVYSGTPLERPPSWEANPSWEATCPCVCIVQYDYFVPLLRGHPFREATFSLQKGWPLKRGSTVYIKEVWRQNPTLTDTIRDLKRLGNMLPPSNVKFLIHIPRDKKPNIY